MRTQDVLSLCEKACARAMAGGKRPSLTAISRDMDTPVHRSAKMRVIEEHLISDHASDPLHGSGVINRGALCYDGSHGIVDPPSPPPMSWPDAVCC